MNFYPLVKKLIEIERAIDVLEPSDIRVLVIEAQDTALQMQKEVVETLGAEYASFRPPVEPEVVAQRLSSMGPKTEKPELASCS